MAPYHIPWGYQHSFSHFEPQALSCLHTPSPSFPHLSTQVSPRRGRLCMPLFSSPSTYCEIMHLTVTSCSSGACHSFQMYFYLTSRGTFLTIYQPVPPLVSPQCHLPSPENFILARSMLPYITTSNLSLLQPPALPHSISQYLFLCFSLPHSPGLTTSTFRSFPSQVHHLMSVLLPQNSPSQIYSC